MDAHRPVSSLWTVVTAPGSGAGCETCRVTGAATELMRLAGGDPFEAARKASEAHQRAHGCGLHTAGPEVMQLAASYVRASGSATVLDLGCGLGYSTLWLADAAGTEGRVIGIDNEEEHILHARGLVDDAGLTDRISFVVGNVADVLENMSGPFDAVHDDAWFASAPSHLEAMIGLLRPGGVLTMPNWFLLVDAISARPRKDWEQYAGRAWAADTLSYAEQLAQRDDLVVNWITEPPLGVAVKV